MAFWKTLTASNEPKTFIKVIKVAINPTRRVLSFATLAVRWLVDFETDEISSISLDYLHVWPIKIVWRATVQKTKNRRWQTTNRKSFFTPPTKKVGEKLLIRIEFSFVSLLVLPLLLIRVFNFVICTMKQHRRELNLLVIYISGETLTNRFVIGLGLAITSITAPIWEKLSKNICITA